MKRTQTRQVRMTIKGLEGQKNKIERRIDNLKCELIKVHQGLDFLNNELSRSLAANEMLRR